MDPKAVALRSQLLPLLDERAPSDDRALLAALEPLARDFRFPGLSHEWAPVLYQRNRVVFRAFLIAHINAFGSGGYYDEQGRAFDAWKRPDTRARLQALLEQVERDHEVQLFRKLFDESIGGVWRNSDTWARELKSRFLACATDRERRRELELMDLNGALLDEDTALALYRTAPAVCGEFLLDHAPRETPWHFGPKRKPWRVVRREAQNRGDHKLASRLFRRQATHDEWAELVGELARGSATTASLLDQLEAHHPEFTPKNAGLVYLSLLEVRGETALPYVLRHLDLRRGFWSSKPAGYDKLIRLASRRGWLTLWAALLRGAGSEPYNEAIEELLDNRDQLGHDEARRRLLLLAGVGREVNFPGFGIAQVMPLHDSVACALYRSYPKLIRGPFRMHLTPGWGRTYGALVEIIIDADDEPLIDWLASRAVTLMGFAFQAKVPKEQRELTELLSRHYEKLLDDPAAFARRAGNVLSGVPAFSIFSYDALIRNNRLARLLFERTHDEYLVDERVVRDLLESPQIHVNRLAYRILAVESLRARELGERNLDLLTAALLRKLHRQTRELALDAIANAVGSEQAAREVLPKARDALRLPDKRYPKDKLVGLIGIILHRFPSLQSASEKPRIFGLEAAR